MRRLRIFLPLILLSACATAPREKVTVQASDFEGLPLVIVNDVPFVEQPLERCGPTALYMAAKPLRPDLELAEVEKLTITPAASGTYKQDLLSAARRIGVAPYTLSSPKEIFSTLASGSPVILFHRTRFLGKEYWHYSVLTGYDRARDDFVVHIGQDSNHRMDMENLLSDWAVGGRWAVQVSPPEKIPASASFDEAVANALVFLRLGSLAEAQALGEAMAARWSARYETDLVLAEVYFRTDRKEDALKALRRASRKQPEDLKLKAKIREIASTER